jgi:alpha-1,2-mannosyltransferase
VLIAVAVAVPGFLLARRLARERWEIAGIAVTALLLVLISPVAWIHYFLLVVIAIGALAGDGRRLRRVLTAAVTAVFFGLTVPWWGQSLLHDAAVPRVVSRVVEDAFGIAAAVLVVIIARTRMTGADRAPDAGDDGPPGSPAEAGDAGPSPGLDRLSSV